MGAKQQAQPAPLGGGPRLDHSAAGSFCGLRKCWCQASTDRSSLGKVNRRTVWNGILS